MYSSNTKTTNKSTRRTFTNPKYTIICIYSLNIHYMHIHPIKVNLLAVCVATTSLFCFSLNTFEWNKLTSLSDRTRSWVKRGCQKLHQCFKWFIWSLLQSQTCCWPLLLFKEDAQQNTLVAPLLIMALVIFGMVLVAWTAAPRKDYLLLMWLGYHVRAISTNKE